MICDTFRTLFASAILASLASSPASAHVTLEDQEAEIGSNYKAVLRIPHGCGEAATKVVRVQIPEGFFNAKPQPKPGWKLETVTGPYETPYDNHGTLMTEGIVEIIWSGGELPDDWFDEFVFRGTFSSALPEGLFWFPTVQECENGEEAWIETDGSANARRPAPSLQLIPAHLGH